VGWVGDTNFIPREKPGIAAALAIAGEFMGNRIIITDTGSDPQAQGYGPVPKEMIKAVKSSISVPYIVAGGIKESAQLREAYAAGADIIQVGSAFETTEASYKTAVSFSKVAKEEGKKKVGR
jgi:heptaprenylglyceryl phosphate synthase